MKKHKIGIFGGNFDPFHHGHLNSMLSVADQFELDDIRVVPAFISPLRVQTQGSTPDQRLEMLRRGIRGHEERIRIDTREIDRGGVSYTIDTVESILKEHPGAEVMLIVGMDQFNKFDQWKSFDKILNLVDLVVTSRPGMELPYSLEDWPLGVRQLVGDHDSKQAMLKTGKQIHFYQLDDVEVSGTEIRKKVRFGQSVQALVPQAVEEYVRESKLYESVQRNIGDFEKFTAWCAKTLIDKGGVNVKVFDLRDRSAPSEFTLVCSGTSTRHATALAEHLIREVKKEYGVWPESIEGTGEGRWIVVDYGALIIHAFYDFVRQEYRLEELWSKPAK
ncbi:MAG TPA: nicotinate (nicotinamide) nucleotide adenylyltransferase [Bdellovibrionales bacterium]|nr:nicotinate (nicotinamide) nucleotide adenylyltransferase [Bdellovibrionales bacterium]